MTAVSFPPFLQAFLLFDFVFVLFTILLLEVFPFCIKQVKKNKWNLIRLNFFLLCKISSGRNY